LDRRTHTEYRIELKALLAAERTGLLTAYRPGRHVLYKRVELEAMIEASRIAVREEVLAPANDAEPDDPFERALAGARHRRR
jgi:hypothetical protein